MDVSLELAQAVLAAQPMSVLLEAELVAFGDGGAVLQVPLTERVLQQHGVAHGGLVSYAADNAITFAAGSVAGPSVLTGDLTISYLRPARRDLIVARAEVVSAGSRVIVCRCDVFDVSDGGDEQICAVAQGSVFRGEG